MTTAEDSAPYSVVLNIDGPRDPGYLLEVAEAFAQAARILNHLTLSHEALEDPSQADALIRYLSSAAYRLPQLLSQASGRLNDMYADGRIRMTGGEFPQAVLAVMAVEARLSKAAEHAEELGKMLNSAASVTTDMAGVDDGSSDEGSGHGA